MKEGNPRYDKIYRWIEMNYMPFSNISWNSSVSPSLSKIIVSFGCGGWLVEPFVFKTVVSIKAGTPHRSVPGVSIGYTHFAPTKLYIIIYARI